jgi:hypothetical protein
MPTSPSVLFLAHGSPVVAIEPGAAGSALQSLATELAGSAVSSASDQPPLGWEAAHGGHHRGSGRQPPGGPGGRHQSR